MKTISEPSVPAPSSEANAAASAASATGPRKKSPGVSTLADAERHRNEHPDEPPHDWRL